VKRIVWPAIALVLWLLPSTARAQDVDDTTDAMQHEWVISGLVGSAFGDDIQEASVDFGGSLSYLFNGMVGAEVLTNFGPNGSFELTNLVVPNGGTWVNSYMVNGILAAPIGGEDRLFQPFVSAGIGAIDVRLDEQDFGDFFHDNLSATQLGANVGVGLMGFSDHMGFRGDVRWFRGLADETSAIGSVLGPDDFLDAAGFFRADVGLSYRW
jgi:hypothetical protein